MDRTPINPPLVEPPLATRSTINRVSLVDLALAGGALAGAVAMIHPVSRAAIVGLGRAVAGGIGRGARGLGRGAGELLEGEALPMQFSSPDSSAIAGAEWDGSTVTIYWRHGGANGYPCDIEEWVGFLLAESKGGYYNETWGG